MNRYLALYVKELKAIRLVSAVLIAATAALVIWVLNDAGDGGVHGNMILLVGPYLCPPLLAGVLMHSITQEWAGATQHQWLALPLPRPVLLLAKVAAVLTLAVAIYLLDTFALYMIHEQVLETLLSLHPEADGQIPSVMHLGSMAGTMFGSTTVLLLGLGLAAAAVKLIVPRFRGLVTVGVFIGGLWLTGRVAHTVSAHLHSVPGTSMERMIFATVNDVHLYITLMGVLFGSLGAVIFDRYVDA